MPSVQIIAESQGKSMDECNTDDNANRNSIELSIKRSFSSDIRTSSKRFLWSVALNIDCRWKTISMCNASARFGITLMVIEKSRIMHINVSIIVERTFNDHCSRDLSLMFQHKHCFRSDENVNQNPFAVLLIEEWLDENQWRSMWSVTCTTVEGNVQ